LFSHNLQESLFEIGHGGRISGALGGLVIGLSSHTSDCKLSAAPNPLTYHRQDKARLSTSLFRGTGRGADRSSGSHRVGSDKAGGFLSGGIEGGIGHDTSMIMQKDVPLLSIL
jgi:hypothetical protein